MTDTSNLGGHYVHTPVPPDLLNRTKQAALAAFIRHPELLPEDALPVMADHCSPTILVRAADLVPELLAIARAKTKNRYFLFGIGDANVYLEPKEFSSWDEISHSDEGDALIRDEETGRIDSFGYLIIRPAPLPPLIGRYPSDDTRMKDPAA